MRVLPVCIAASIQEIRSFPLKDLSFSLFLSIATAIVTHRMNKRNHSPVEIPPTSVSTGRILRHAIPCIAIAIAIHKIRYRDHSPVETLLPPLFLLESSCNLHHSDFNERTHFPVEIKSTRVSTGKIPNFISSWFHIGGNL
jgi:hypothetical protein